MGVFYVGILTIIFHAYQPTSSTMYGFTPFTVGQLIKMNTVSYLVAVFYMTFCAVVYVLLVDRSFTHILSMNWILEQPLTIFALWLGSFLFLFVIQKWILHAFHFQLKSGFNYLFNYADIVLLIGLLGIFFAVVLYFLIVYIMNAR